jgi:hypothetical protein
MSQRLIDAKSRQRKYQLRHKRAGLCYECSRPIASGSVFCELHRRKRNLENRERQRKRFKRKIRYRKAESYRFRRSNAYERKSAHIFRSSMGGARKSSSKRGSHPVTPAQNRAKRLQEILTTFLATRLFGPSTTSKLTRSLIWIFYLL